MSLLFFTVKQKNSGQKNYQKYYGDTFVTLAAAIISMKYHNLKNILMRLIRYSLIIISSSRIRLICNKKKKGVPMLS